jgi:hypothetical protein
MNTSHIVSIFCALSLAMSTSGIMRAEDNHQYAPTTWEVVKAKLGHGVDRYLNLMNKPAVAGAGWGFVKGAIGGQLALMTFGITMLGVFGLKAGFFEYTSLENTLPITISLGCAGAVFYAIAHSENIFSSTTRAKILAGDNYYKYSKNPVDDTFAKKVFNWVSILTGITVVVAQL